METPSKECLTESLSEERLWSEGLGLDWGLVGDWDLRDEFPRSSSQAPETLGLRSAALSLEELTMLESDCVARIPTEAWEEVARSLETFGAGSLGGDGLNSYKQETTWGEDEVILANLSIEEVVLGMSRR